MAKAKTESGLIDESGNDIVDLNANWTSKPYSLGDFRSFGIQLLWDNAAVTGTMVLEYTCDPSGARDGAEIGGWTEKNLVALDGSFAELLFLDADVPIANWRLRFVHTAGSANLETFVTRRQ